MCTDTTENHSSGIQLDPIIWAIIGFAVGMILTVLLCLLIFTCCACYKAKRNRYDVQQGWSKPVFRMHGYSNNNIISLCVLAFINLGAESMMVENPGAADIWTNDLDDKHRSSSKLDPIELTSTTTF